MVNLAFFYRWTSGSGKIRGKQMGRYLNAKLGPKRGYSQDICIYVKTTPPDNYPRNTYLDIVDGMERVAWLLQHPDVGVICISKVQLEYLTEKLKRNDLIFIPENHCNYLREKRTRTEVNTVGFIGRPAGIQYDIEDLRKRLSEIGMILLVETVYPTRESVCEFYKKIDIQIVWRTGWKGAHEMMRNPLKLCNAGSFGIPTVAYPELSYVSEFDGYFLPATTIDEFISQIKRLKEDKELYEDLAQRNIEKCEEYHIETVAKKYKDLIKLYKEGVMNVGIRAKLLEKEVTIDGKKRQIYGLASFNVSPRPRGLGKVLCREFDRLAQEDGKYCVIGFAFDEVAGFYEKCGWYNCGKKDKKTAYSTRPIKTLEYDGEW
jgi:hypothetical protein